MFTKLTVLDFTGEFLSALANHVRSTYLNRNSIAVYRIMSCRMKLPMPLNYDFNILLPINFSCKYEPWVQAMLPQSLPINWGQSDSTWLC